LFGAFRFEKSLEFGEFGLSFGQSVIFAIIEVTFQTKFPLQVSILSHFFYWKNGQK